MARVVVVGGGLGGTATAARLAKLGHAVTLVEKADRLGGAVGFLEQDGFRWDTGPTATMLPAVVRDLFRKSGRPLERELELVPVQPAREHRFEDGTTLAMPTGSRSVQLEAVDAALGAGAGRQWVDHVHAFADTWDVLRRSYLERPWSPEHVDRATLALLHTRTTLQKVVARTLKDPRLRQVALAPAVLDGHDPRNVPGWLGMLAYVEQNFGVWTVPGGLGALGAAMTKRLGERRVEVLTGTCGLDIVVRDGRAVAVETDRGNLDADVVVCAVDPRTLPALARFVSRTMPAIPPTVVHVGLRGPVPELPHEVVLHGDKVTMAVRTHGTAPEGGAAWTVLGRGRIEEDLLTGLARRGLDVRDQVVSRVDRSPRDIVVEYSGSPYGVLWQGRGTLTHRLGTRTPVPGVFCAGAHVAASTGLPFVGLTAAVVAEQVGAAAKP
ncbi:MAG: phytoene desaturase family protein [Nocardioidaceae bacterium]